MARKLKQPTFETERLRLRPFRTSDAKALHALYGDVENLRYWGTDPSPDLDSTRKMLRWHISFHPFHYALWAVEERRGLSLVGLITYHGRAGPEYRAVAGCWFLPCQRVRGYLPLADAALCGNLSGNC